MVTVVPSGSQSPWCVSKAGMALSCADSRLSERVVGLEQTSVDTHWPTG